MHAEVFIKIYFKLKILHSIQILLNFFMKSQLLYNTYGDKTYSRVYNKCMLVDKMCNSVKNNWYKLNQQLL